MRYIEGREDVKFIRMAFCDVYGRLERHIRSAAGA